MRPPSHTAVPVDVVATAADRHQQMVGAGEIDGMDHVGHASAAGDERRPCLSIMPFQTVRASS